MRLFFYQSPHFYTAVGTHEGARGASDAFVRRFGEGEVVSAVVYFFGLEAENIGGACHHAKVATLAALSVDFHGSYNFCHFI